MNIGTIELLQMLIGMLSLHGPFFGWIGNLGLDAQGYIIVTLLLLAWCDSFALWKFGDFTNVMVVSPLSMYISQR